MANHSSILARKIPLTEEPGGLQSVALQRVRHDQTHTHTHTHTSFTSQIKCPFLRHSLPNQGVDSAAILELLCHTLPPPFNGGLTPC